MSGPYDKALKRLVDDNPEDFAHWAMQFLEGQQVVVIDKRATEFNTTLTADAILDVVMDGERILLHFEFQAKNEKDVPLRALEYHVRALRQYKLPTFSFVIYLKEDGNPPESPMRCSCFGKRTIRFDYAIIDLSEMKADDLRQIGLPGLQPLMILTQDGATREVAEEIMTMLEVTGKGDTLLTAYMLITLVFGKKSQEDREWLQRRWNIMSDILRDTWVYQEILKEGQEKGIEKGIEKGREIGLEEGIEKGRQEGLEALRQAMLGLVQARFSDKKIERQARGQAAIIKDPKILQDLIVKVGAAQTAEEAQDYLLSWKEAS